MVVSDAERGDLHNAIVEYLTQHGFTSEAAVVEAALKARAPSDFVDKPTTLEKKWNTLVRLNRSVSALEDKCKRLQASLDEVQDPTKRVAGAQDTLPREPFRASLAGHRDTLTCVEFHPFEPQCFSSSEDGSVRIWDLQSRTCTSVIKLVDSVSWISMEPTKGKLLAVACGDQSVKLYEDGDCVITLHGHEHAVTSAIWLGDAVRTLVSGSRDGEVRIWDTIRGTTNATINVGGYIRSLSGTPTLLAIGSDDCAHIVNLGSKQTVRRIGPLEHAIQSVQLSNFNADVTLIEAHGTAEQKTAMKALQRQRQQCLEKEGTTPTYDPQFVAIGGRDKNILIVEIASGTTWLTIKTHDNWVRQAIFTANGKHLLSCSDDGKLCAFDLTLKKVVRAIVAHDHFTTCLALHPTAPLIATGSADHTLRLWPCS